LGISPKGVFNKNDECLKNEDVVLDESNGRTTSSFLERLGGGVQGNPQCNYIETVCSKVDYPSS
jgi:hypothetical protein